MGGRCDGGIIGRGERVCVVDGSGGRRDENGYVPSRTGSGGRYLPLQTLCHPHKQSLCTLTPLLQYSTSLLTCSLPYNHISSHITSHHIQPPSTQSPISLTSPTHISHLAYQHTPKKNALPRDLPPVVYPKSINNPIPIKSHPAPGKHRISNILGFSNFQFQKGPQTNSR
jgi:hypothetical protein